MLRLSMTLHEIIEAVKNLPEDDQAKLRDEVWPSSFVPTDEQRADLDAAIERVNEGRVVGAKEIFAVINRRR